MLNHSGLFSCQRLNYEEGECLQRHVHMHPKKEQMHAKQEKIWGFNEGLTQSKGTFVGADCSGFYVRALDRQRYKKKQLQVELQMLPPPPGPPTTAVSKKRPKSTDLWFGGCQTGWAAAELEGSASQPAGCCRLSACCSCCCYHPWGPPLPSPWRAASPATTETAGWVVWCSHMLTHCRGVFFPVGSPRQRVHAGQMAGWDFVVCPAVPCAVLTLQTPDAPLPSAIRKFVRRLWNSRGVPSSQPSPPAGLRNIMWLYQSVAAITELPLWLWVTHTSRI